MKNSVYLKAFGFLTMAGRYRSQSITGDSSEHMPRYWPGTILPEFFEVSKTAAKIRMIDLG